MCPASRDIAKRVRKPRPKQTGLMIGLRLQPEQLASIDAWRAHHPDKPSRPEAIRQLAEKGLKGQ